MVPQQATEPAVALPISGNTSSCSLRALSLRPISIRRAPAPTMTSPLFGSPISLKWLMPTAVPAVAAHSLSECREPIGRTGEGYRLLSLTISCSWLTLVGVTVSAGVQTAHPFQFRIALSAALAHRE